MYTAASFLLDTVSNDVIIDKTWLCYTIQESGRFFAHCFNFLPIKNGISGPASYRFSPENSTSILAFTSIGEKVTSYVLNKDS